MFVAMHKCYSGTIRLGEGTATYDAEAEVTERLPWEHITGSIGVGHLETIQIGEGTATYNAEAEVTMQLPWENITGWD
eukprot:365861-Chlamydomonas_euryale.AAC.6